PIQPFQLITTSGKGNIRHRQAYFADTRVGWRALSVSHGASPTIAQLHMGVSDADSGTSALLFGKPRDHDRSQPFLSHVHVPGVRSPADLVQVLEEFQCLSEGAPRFIGALRFTAFDSKVVKRLGQFGNLGTGLIREALIDADRLLVMLDRGGTFIEVDPQIRVIRECPGTGLADTAQLSTTIPGHHATLCRSLSRLVYETHIRKIRKSHFPNIYAPPTLGTSRSRISPDPTRKWA